MAAEFFLPANEYFLLWQIHQDGHGQDGSYDSWKLRMRFPAVGAEPLFQAAVLCHMTRKRFSGRIPLSHFPLPSRLTWPVLVLGRDKH